MDRGGGNFRGGRSFGRGGRGGRGGGRGRGRGRGGGRGGRGGGNFQQRRHDNQGYDQGYAPPPQMYPQQQYGPPQGYPQQQYPPPQQGYPPQGYPPQDQYQPPQYQQQSYGDDGRGGYNNDNPPMDNRYQPVDNFQQQSQYQSQQPQQQWQQPPPQQYQQFQEESSRFQNNPPMPPQPPTDYADAARTRQQAYAPVPPEEDASEAPQSSYQESNQPPPPPQDQQWQQQPPLPPTPQDPRGEWQQPPTQEQQWQQPPPQQWQQPPPPQDQQWQQPPPPQQWQQPPPQQGPPQMDQRHFQTDQNPRFHDRRQDRHDRHHKQHRPPPPSYVCHNCNQPGHWKQHCPLFANENDRFGSRPEDQFQQQYGAGPTGPDRQWTPAPPLPGAKPQDPRRHGASFNNAPQGDSGFGVKNEPSGQPPLPNSPAPPLPPNAQPPLPYDDGGYGRQPLQSQPQPGQQVWKCETCVKSFVIESQYEAHIGTHVACSDCDFSASKRVVTAHYQTAHGQYAGQGLKEIDVEGQKFMVLVGNSAEDIAKWREERRKKWLAMSRQPKPATTAPVPAPVAGKRKLSVSSEEDLEEGEIEEDEEAKGQIVLRNALATPEPGAQEPPVKKQRKTMLCKWFSRGHCRFDEAHCKYSHDRSAFGCRAMMFKGSCSKGMYCPFSHDTAVLSGQRERSQKASKERATEQQWRGEQKSLLRKLLAKDVRVEQRKMLQIVHFLVANEFLRSPDGEKADVSAKEPAVKIEVLKSDAASTAAAAEASDPIKSESEDTVMEEASDDVKTEHASTEEPISAAPSQVVDPTKVVADENVVSFVEASACEQESQGVSKSPDAEKSDAVVASLDGDEVKAEAAKEEEEETVKDASSSADSVPVDPEVVAAAVPSKGVEPVKAVPDSGEESAQEVLTSGQADTLETSTSEANEAC